MPIETELKNTCIPSETERLLENQDRLLSELSDVLGRLQTKISHVLGEIPSSTDSSKNIGLPTPDFTLGETLFNYNNRIESKINFVNELIERIRL